MSINPTVDQRGRGLRDLRISLTDKCNMRCRYCMPSEIFGPNYRFLESSKQLSFDEIVRIARISETLGVEKIRLTGGEPLMRRKVTELVGRLANETEVKDIALTTNGLLLPKLAHQLKSNGLRRVNLSLDALNPAIFKQMSGGFGDLNQVIRAIDICKDHGISLKINTVLKRGVNDSEIIPMIAFGIEKGIEVRFIEYMDVGCSNSWEKHEVVTEKSVLSTVEKTYGKPQPLPADPTAVARSFRLNEHNYEFGIIASITRPFCGGCVRGRISSDGKLYTCLFSNTGYNLRDFMRKGVSDDELVSKLNQLWSLRSDRYSELREKPGNESQKIEMSYIGG